MLNLEHWLTTGGVVFLALVVFAESGLLIGFFLPGDTLLFVAGFLSSAAGGHLLPPLPITAAIVFTAAFAGDQAGYVIGRKVGPALFNRPQGRLFNPANAEHAQQFFQRRGPRAVVLARFVPVVRTFTPMVAGIADMPYRTFVTYNLIGALLWGVGMTTLGSLVGQVALIKNNLDYAALAILAVSLIPVGLQYWRQRSRLDARHSR